MSSARGDQGGEVFDSQPNVLLGRSASGTVYFRVQVLAEDSSSEALEGALSRAREVYDELARIYTPEAGP